MCSDSVKCSLFRTYITPLYTAQLWSNYKKNSMQRLKVAYNDSMRLLLRVPIWHSASQLFVYTSAATCEVVLRTLMFSCMCRLESENHIIEALVSPLKSCYRFSSRLRRHRCNSLYILWADMQFLCIFVCPFSYYLYCMMCCMDLGLQ